MRRRFYRVDRPDLYLTGIIYADTKEDDIVLQSAGGERMTYHEALKVVTANRYHHKRREKLYDRHELYMQPLDLSKTKVNPKNPYVLERSTP